LLPLIIGIRCQRNKNQYRTNHHKSGDKDKSWAKNLGCFSSFSSKPFSLHGHTFHYYLKIKTSQLNPSWSIIKIMYGMSFMAVIAGGILIWISSRNSSKQLRQIGLGLIIVGIILFALSRFNVPLLPS